MSTSLKHSRGVLIYQTGSKTNELIKLRSDGTIFGRFKADIVIDDREVSSTHFQIQVIDDEYHVFDMNSSNGTFLNSQRVIKAKLKEGDVLTVGNTSFRFSMIDEKKVRHIPTLFHSSATATNKSQNSIVDTLIDRELSDEMRPTIIIEVVYGDDEREIIELYDKVVFIGRASSFGKFDKDTEISRKHLLVKLNDSGEIFIEDQRSTNGSYLNGRKINGLHRVSRNDRIRVGLCRMRLYAG